jgi:hypothetical protein
MDERLGFVARLLEGETMTPEIKEGSDYFSLT